MADVKGREKDVVADGGIKCSIPGVKALFASCAANNPKPDTPAPAAPNGPNAAAQLVNDGAIGDGMAAGAGKALMNRQSQLEAQMAKAGI